MKLHVRPRSVHPHRWLWRVGPIAVSLVALAACGAPTVDLRPTDAPAIASKTDGRLTMTLSLPKTTWAVGEDITGTATLSLEPGPDMELSGSGRPIAFSYTEVGGTHQVEPVFTADCAPHPLAAEVPIVQPLAKSGSWSPDTPDADFTSTFLTEPGIHLPAGDWDIRVELALNEGPGCDGPAVDLSPTVRVHVTHEPAPSPEP